MCLETVVGLLLRNLLDHGVFLRPYDPNLVERFHGTTPKLATPTKWGKSEAATSSGQASQAAQILGCIFRCDLVMTEDWLIFHFANLAFLRATRRTSWLLRAMSPEQTSSDGKFFVASSCIHGIHGEGLSRKPYHFSLYIDSLSFFSEHGKGLSQIPHNTNTYISIWR